MFFYSYFFKQGKLFFTHDQKMFDPLQNMQPYILQNIWRKLAAGLPKIAMLVVQQLTRHFEIFKIPVSIWATV